MPAPSGHPWLEAIRSRGWYGVDMFFILSGFLITWILAVEVETTGTVSLGRFYRARTLRLLPAYLSTIVLVLAGSRLFEIAQGNQSYRLAELWPLFLSYTLNIWMATTAIWPWGVSHFWSLCVEEHFYLSWSAVMKRWGLRHVLADGADRDSNGRGVSNRMVPVDEPRASRCALAGVLLQDLLRDRYANRRDPGGMRARAAGARGASAGSSGAGWSRRPGFRRSRFAPRSARSRGSRSIDGAPRLSATP